ncbi:cypemycin family RiPP [Auritidibacter ignavus]|uniref:Cypemycin family RiPP n=1 Tax=Auritidibacter ignavus TaxID=678932 RepID=A0AAJ6ANL6_9MICC|nr:MULTISPECIES: cypemycin family RiPP [Auritidibacter]WGH94088.1 cypemycin family RiPP [Auritidibacter ignavus]WHS27617.1 cypemycin family RiPP [Auritidibacter ignavus]
MSIEIDIVQQFANETFKEATPGFVTAAETPAMATPGVTPATPHAAQYVVQGSTICLIC